MAVSQQIDRCSIPSNMLRHGRDDVARHGHGLAINSRDDIANPDSGSSGRRTVNNRRDCGTLLVGAKCDAEPSSPRERVDALRLRADDDCQ
jgi:hypothetical protein